jgi:plasmid rolling circle replication initiator protein Rep
VGSTISQLIEITSNNKDNGFLTGAHLLLGNTEMASYYFKKIPEKDQEEFKKYPINIFW